MLKQLCILYYYVAYHLHCSVCWFAALGFVSDFKSCGVSFKGTVLISFVSETFASNIL
jgi:hypothetical protein